MTAPLYLDANIPASCHNGHYGLWFERFANFYETDFSIKKKKMIDGKEQNPGAAWLQKHFRKKVGDRQQLVNHSQRQMQLVKSLDGESLVFKADWHFVTGMGNPHPVENGFAWHPALGVPYLTGAAVKGLVRSYIENYLDTQATENPAKEELLLQWFGSTNKDPASVGYQAQAGTLILFDALPVEPVLLGVDIMTPHMGKWYADGAERAGQADAVPADWHDPMPVSFLVAQEVSLLFSFALRPHPGDKKQQVDIDFKAVADVLERVLKHEGAGAKTTTGYGGFHRDTDALSSLKKAIEKEEETRQKIEEAAEKEAERTEALSKMSPLEREIEGLLSANADTLNFNDAVNKLKNGHWEGAEQQSAASYLKARMQDEKHWKETTAAKKPGKDKVHQRTLIVMKFL